MAFADSSDFATKPAAGLATRRSASSVSGYTEIMMTRAVAVAA
ncbi:MAG: hypothetical protein QOF59_2807, partial [Actinomycetota bacterium]|nr:hypothetical protein [Actinomycetota bacterium]